MTSQAIQDFLSKLSPPEHLVSVKVKGMTLVGQFHPSKQTPQNIANNKWVLTVGNDIPMDGSHIDSLRVG